MVGGVSTGFDALMAGGSVESYLIYVFRESANNAEQMTVLYAKQMEASNMRVEKLNDLALYWMNVSTGVVTEEETQVDGYEWPDSYGGLDMLGADGKSDEYPDWLGERWPSEEEADALSRQFTNKASSETSAGTLLMSKLTSATNAKDEADRAISSFLSKTHEALVFIGSKI